MRKHAARTAAIILLCALLAGGAEFAPRAAYGLEGATYQQLFVWLTPTPTATATPGVTPKPTSAPTPSATPAPAATASAATPAPSAMPAVTLSAAQLAALSPTVRMSFAELVGDNGVYESPAGYPAADTFQVIVDIYHQVVLVYGRDASGQYTVPVRFMVCTTGKQKTPTPTGIFLSGGRRVRFGYFSEHDVYGQYWTQITRSIYFHSLLYAKKDADTYTATSYRNLGKRASHGCVRLLVPDARWVYYHIAPGTQVTIRRGDKGDLVTAAIKVMLTRAKLPSRRPNLNPSTLPSTDNWDIRTYLAGYSRVVSAG